MTTAKAVPGVIASIDLLKSSLIRSSDGRYTDEELAHLKEAVNAPVNPVVYLSIDPGESNGICGYDVKYHLLFMLVVKEADMIRFLAQFEHIKHCICEGYLLFPNKARQQIYSDMKTPKVIGRVESWSEINEIELHMQPPTIKVTGYKWIGKRPLPKSNPQNHPMDAHVHFMYWGITTGRIKLEDLLRK